MSVNLNLISVKQSKQPFIYHMMVYLPFIYHMMVYLTLNLFLTIGLFFGHYPLGNDVDSQGEG